MMPSVLVASAVCEALKPCSVPWLSVLSITPPTMYGFAVEPPFEVSLTARPVTLSAPSPVSSSSTSL